jgi:hypothetical protein
MIGRHGAEASTNEGDAHRTAEMLEDFRRVAGGTRESTDRERQTFAAAEENTNPQVAIPGLDQPIVNRRIRNRTYGGVGGRRERPRLLPDSA